MFKFGLSTLLLVVFFLSTKPAQAIVNPLDSPNNKFGIHIISASKDEVAPVKELVNATGGDWGYVTFLIESTQRDRNRWQEFFDQLRENHLIPIVRLATQPENPPAGGWKKPYEGEEIAWADFLDNLNWPIKNRYVVIYNEPNHGREWGNLADAKDYARTLDKTITALKKKSPDFFVINAGLDASAPDRVPNYQDELIFLRQMDEEIPGIFEKLDGWASHSYPNPGFMGGPNDKGRGTIRTFAWELQALKNLGVKKNLPVFITETGWKHAEGLNFDPSLPNTEVTGEYYKKAFQEAWSDYQIVAVTPFLLDYQEVPFDHFSFKKLNGKDYYEHYYSLKELPKISGQPVQENKFELQSGQIYPSLVADEEYLIPFVFKNTGQSIWNDGNPLNLVSLSGREDLNIESSGIPKELRIKPGEEFTFNIRLKAPHDGKYQISLNLFSGDREFDNPPLQYETQVKSPVLIRIKTALKWKSSAAGNYLLIIAGSSAGTIKQIVLRQDGTSQDINAGNLPPDLNYQFTLEKPFYKPKIISRVVTSNLNILDFGQLQPDIPSALLNPKALWNLLPFSDWLQ